MFHEWYYYWSPVKPLTPELKKKWSVDILTTSCPGEPPGMVIRTLKAMRNVRYPHTDYLCDEGDDPILKKVCGELGVIHVTRKEKINAKAGNINNALKQATGEICLVLDPDHVPRPEFLDRILPHFENEEVGFVQCVQAYGNQEESFIARGAAEQTYHFYGPMMMTMNSYGTVQAIGANCTFRRKALDSIGGHAAGLAEDMHTAMQLHAKGWKSVYVPEILARGLVPATLSSFYKQQLKWSRGVFELLFRVFPLLYKNFTWRQRIHYFAIPWYFLFGLINLIDISIPLYALAVARVPWEIELVHFASYFLPMCAMSLVVRFYVQRWLLEKHERGLHLTGGMLRAATWWIYLVGFIYAVFNINVPYIPTPKEDEHQNYVKLCIPNICVIVISGLFITYGLWIDWSPYSMAMAFYALVVMGMLAYTTLMSQQKFLKDVKEYLQKIRGYSNLAKKVRNIFENAQQATYGLLQNGATIVVLALSALFLSYTRPEPENAQMEAIEKEYGGFYIGTEGSALKNPPLFCSVFALNANWNDSAAFPLQAMNVIKEKNALPFVNWLLEEPVYGAILDHQYDEYLKKCAKQLRTFKEPIFLSLDLVTCSKGLEKNYIDAWQYIYGYFSKNGISNITWVWSPSRPDCKAYYPGDLYVDWICIRGNKDQSFDKLYENYLENIPAKNKPMIIRGLHSENEVTEFLKHSKDKHPEIRSILLTESAANALEIHGTLTSISNTKPFFKNGHLPDLSDKKYNSAFIKGKPGNFSLYNGKDPYYIKGVAYNTAHDWRDGFMPLTRRQVEKDMQMIKEMGANTIRRYDQGIYDRNILTIAQEQGLKVLYGFWFDPKTDYYKDTLKVREYIKDVEEKVLALKDKPSILAWSIGNETWGLLKHNFSRPYLTKVRGEYVKLLEYLAQRIHELDPAHPVFACIEHEEHQLAGELVALHDGSPSLDAIGINSYYKEQISRLKQITYKFDSLRPYLVSEFGPSGYWKYNYNKSANGLLIEESESEKANWYKQQWKEYVEGNKGSNIGGFAYCWHDRMEGSCTWFGLTDYKGRPKPSYFALKESWTGIKSSEVNNDLAIYSVTACSTSSICKFKATGKNKKPGLNYEWHMYKEDFSEVIDDIEYLNNGETAVIQMPDDTSGYRLYVYVTENGERVRTASLPVKPARRK